MTTKKNVLDNGCVVLKDHMGNDSTIVESARVSFGKGTKTLFEDSKLIKYLLRNRHTSPFEMVEFRFIIKLPIFVMRQLVRHRTANINEISARYSELSNDYYLPNQLFPQAKINKQCSDRSVPLDASEELINEMRSHSENSHKLYSRLLVAGVSRETARLVLPTNVYTHIIWKIDLHNLLKFLTQRLDESAQFEIQCYANAILELIRPVVPITIKHYQNLNRDCEK